MVIQATVIEPGSEQGKFDWPGWWMEAQVAIEGLSEPGKEPDRAHRDRMRQWHRPRCPEVNALAFLVDTGATFTQLGTRAIHALGITRENTYPAESATMAGGESSKYRAVMGQLWIQHKKHPLARDTYSAFDLQFFVPEAALSWPDGRERIFVDSLIGMDVLDVLVTYGSMYRLRPPKSERSPVMFGIRPNSRRIRIGRRGFWFESPWRFPHDPARLAEERHTPLEIGSVRGLRATAPSAQE